MDIWVKQATEFVVEIPQKTEAPGEADNTGIWVLCPQGGRSWRASGDHQISLNASAERAFANFRDKKHRILQLQIFAT